MVKHSPATWWRVVIAASVTTVVAFVPMAALLMSQNSMPDTGVVTESRYGGSAFLAVLVVAACAAVAMATVALATARRLRLPRGQA